MDSAGWYGTGPSSGENVLSAIAQKSLFETYRSNSKFGSDGPNWKDVGFRVHSQHEEDGYILYLFAVLGFTNRRVVEICCGSGDECNTANLLINHRAVGLLFEGNQKLAERARTFFANEADTKLWPPQLIEGWVTAENINSSIEGAGWGGEVDLLSLDIDGIDYWLWKAITAINPRIVVAEINHLWGTRKAVTVPYSPNFEPVFTKYGSDYAGASILAFQKLAAEKGYRLVGGNSIGTNVFFVRDDLVHPWLPAIDAASLFWHPRAQFGMDVRFEGIRHMNWQDV